MPLGERAELKQRNARVFFTDKIDGVNQWVEGRVVEYRSVDYARRVWRQPWPRCRPDSTILRIMPKGRRNFQHSRYRRLSAVRTPKQHEEKTKRREDHDE